MAGRRYGTFRRGDVAEALGIALLRTIATVAEVPRQEDVGIDLIANLLREEKDGHLYAEDAFSVQLKSNHDPIILSAHEVRWFMDLAVPHFVGHVDRENGSLELFTTHYGRLAVLAGDSTSIRFQYERAPGHIAVAPFKMGHFLDGDMAIVWLGDPVVRIVVGQSTPPVHYAALKSFLWAERMGMQFARVGAAAALAWRTNVGVVDAHTDQFFGRRIEIGLPDLAEHLAPLMFGILGYGQAANDGLSNAGNALQSALVGRGIGDPSHGGFRYWSELFRCLLLRQSKLPGDTESNSLDDDR